MDVDGTASANGDSVRPSDGFDSRGLTDGEVVEVVLALDGQAPAAARSIVAQCLREKLVASDLESARLLMTELVANSLRHSDGPVDEVIVSVELWSEWFQLGVQDSGSGAVITARPADFDSRGGFGLNIVHQLSKRWGVQRIDEGGTRVWAQLLRSPRGDATGPGTNGSQRREA
jgi:anti-sigma regulatory factor (Ser/Thr protein kinase)